MIIQWCVKGLALPDDDTAQQILDRRAGIVCNWWMNSPNGAITLQERREKLTLRNLDFHVNHYTGIDPITNEPFCLRTPFISLSAGTIERDTAAKANFLHRARYTALWFATEFGRRDTAYLFTCWVLLGPRPSVEIEGVAEEIRDLNSYRSYSAFQTEGEVAAKVNIPDNQIQGYEVWRWDKRGLRFTRGPIIGNPRFTPPEQLTNVRELI